MIDLQKISEIMNELHVEASYIFNNWIVLAILVFSFFVATYTDMTSMKIYDRFNQALAFLRICLIPVIPVTSSTLIGCVIGFVVLVIPAIMLMHKCGGDIKFVSVLGSFLGGGLTIIFMFFSCAYMLIYSGIRKIQTKKPVSKIPTPFAPFFFLSFLTIWALFACGVL